MPVKVRDITRILEGYFPLCLAESWDNCGLQLGSADAVLNTVITALDLDEFVMSHALEQKAELIITHHPLIFQKISRINYQSAEGDMIRRLIQNNINVYSAHTNLDAGEHGLNQLLAEKMGLENIKPLVKQKQETLYKIVVFVPDSHENTVRSAMLDAGAGSIGRYSKCSFRTEGIGTFLPGEETNPFIGQKGELEEVKEYRLETIVPEPQLHQVIQEMLKAHPYEEVAYDIYSLKNGGRVYSCGRIGTLAAPLRLHEYAVKLKDILGLDHMKMAGDPNQVIKKTAIVSGAGASFIPAARSMGADVLVTGDIKYHEAKDAVENGLALIDAGHQGTEKVVSHLLAEILIRECSARDLQIKILPVDSPALIKNV